MIKVLIVDDKAENIYLLQSMLDNDGFKTISARNGAEALGLLRTIIPDLIIADILMPVMDGFTLCRECKKDDLLKYIPFFFYTATYIDAKDEEYALSLGADRFILKPQEPDVFLKIITDFLEEVKKNTIHPKKIVQQPEEIVLKEYNEVLIRKIEDKMLQTEKSEKELKKYAEKLEKEIDARKKKEASLLKSEEYNRLLFNTSPIGLALCRMDGTFLDINPAYAKIIGRSIEETLKLTYWDITPEKYAPREAEQLRNLEETGHYGKYEKEYIHKDGHLVPVILQGLILERDGERVIWSSIEDITERKKAEIALLESQHLFQTLAQVSPVGIFRTTSDGQTTYINPKWSEISGLSGEKALGYGWLSAVHPEDRGKLSESWINNLKSKNESSAEYRFLRPDGNIAWVLGKAVPEIIGNEVAGYFGTITDITERKLAEEDLQISEKQLSTIYKSVGDIIFYLAIEAEGNYRFISVSQTFYNVTGLKPEMIIGKLVTEVIPEPSLSFVLGKYIQAIQEKTIIKWEETSEYPTGKLIGEVSITPVVDNNGLCTHLVGSIHDITKMKLAEEELINAKEKAEESDRLKTAFLHNISHEVRTPMNAIVGFSELITDPDLTQALRNEFIQIIVQASNQLLSIITQIINMATIEAGQVKIYEKEISLNSIFKIVSDQFGAEARRKNITLEYHTGLSDNEDKIRTDETKLIQIISNLLSNALKFTKQGSINFGYVVNGNCLEFYFKDTGIGIQEDLHEKIFERFRQVETTLAREYEGAGLGLSISKSYVEILGGEIWLNSKLGEGSEFYFTVPFERTSFDPKPYEIITGKSKKVPEKPVTILITEDVDNNFSLLVQYLSNANIEVIRAVNGKEAIEKCKMDKEIQLVLMDLKMPVMDGFEATRAIKAIRPELPVIAQTAYAQYTDKDKALESGCSDFLCKPFKKEELLTVIRKHIVFD
jgi:PAS domain S-box-containing protein